MDTRRIRGLALAGVMALGLALLPACGQEAQPGPEDSPSPAGETVDIRLADGAVTVDGEAATGDSAQAVYVANDIVYYEAGRDFTYGEGGEADGHSAGEAGAHTVVHITRPGTYSLSGKLSQGQIAVDLGEEAEDNPEAVVTLILDGADITCTVAPAVIFYNVYECGDKDTPTRDVDTSAAGANVVIADGSVNTVSGSYVARIYEPGTVELTEDGTEVADAKKLHKYDAAFYSKMSMNVTGGEAGDGLLNIHGENEGLDSELHLTVNGGRIDIVSGNDGINTNEDGVSVTTINGGVLTIHVDGSTGEGDGIDSNGWLVINGGTVRASACASSGDSGIDADMGIHINGGVVTATGNMLDRIEEGGQTYAVFAFSGGQASGLYTLERAEGGQTFPWTATNSFTYLLVSHPDLAPGDYTLWGNGVQYAHSGQGMMGGMGRPQGGMAPPEGEAPGEPPQLPDGEPQPPEDMGTPPDGMAEPGQPPQGMTPPEGAEGAAPPEGGMPQPGGERPGQGVGGGAPAGESSTTFTIMEGANYFSGLTPVE